MIIFCFYYLLGQWEGHNSKPRAASRCVDPGLKVLKSSPNGKHLLRKLGFFFFFWDTERTFQVRPLWQWEGQAGGMGDGRRLYPNTTTVTPYFGDPWAPYFGDPWAKATSQKPRQSAPLYWKICFLSQPELLCFPWPISFFIYFLTSLSVSSKTSPPHNTHCQIAPSK